LAERWTAAKIAANQLIRKVSFRMHSSKTTGSGQECRKISKTSLSSIA
jgi:hypothetical protein